MHSVSRIELSGESHMTSTLELLRDEKGRPLAEDGWPMSGLAQVREIAAASSLSTSTIYQMISDGSLPSRPFGRARRVEWAVVRRLFLTPQLQD